MTRCQVITTIDPYSGEPLGHYPVMGEDALEAVVEQADRAQRMWRTWPVRARAGCLLALERLLLEGRDRLAELMAAEMGKVLDEGRAEIDKCARACAFFAEHAEDWLRSEPVATEAVDSRIEYEPCGVVLAVMPWNFPFWQVLRFGLPALVAGNGILLKHAPNVSGCALELERLCREAEFPLGLLRCLLIDIGQVPQVIADRRVAAVTLTGSVPAGRHVAALAGQALKKSVLELGGSDPFIVLDDADIEQAASAAVASRFQNCGQVCIAAKRLIVTEPVRVAFEDALRDRIEALHYGDPRDVCNDLGPMARADLRAQVHRQLQAAVVGGARLVLGGQLPAGRGFLYPPTLLVAVHPASTVGCEEVFGPVAVVIGVGGDDEALHVANAIEYGLAGSVWTRDLARGARLARRIEAGAVFVNRAPFSDPRMPFGGIKQSGYGRELSRSGMLEFCASRSVWVDHP